MNRFLDVFQSHAFGDGEAHLGDHLASVFANNGRRNDFVRSLFAVDPSEAAMLTFGLCPIIVFHWQFVSVEIGFLFLDF